MLASSSWASSSERFSVKAAASWMALSRERSFSRSSSSFLVSSWYSSEGWVREACDYHVTFFTVLGGAHVIHRGNFHMTSGSMIVNVK